MRNDSPSGWHLIIDAIVGDPTRLADVSGLETFLRKLVDHLGMELLDGPRMTQVELDPNQLETDEDDGGVTGYALITTSHCAIHTWPLRSRFCMDVFSCKPFDQAAALEFIRTELGVTSDNVQWLERHWPQPAATPLAPTA